MILYNIISLGVCRGECMLYVDCMEACLQWSRVDEFVFWLKSVEELNHRQFPQWESAMGEPTAQWRNCMYNSNLLWNNPARQYSTVTRLHLCTSKGMNEDLHNSLCISWLSFLTVWARLCVGGRVFDFRLYFFFASKRNEANRDPFRMRFACSLWSFRFLFFAIFAYFRIKLFFVFALFRFINFVLNINCWIWVFSYIICSM